MSLSQLLVALALSIASADADAKPLPALCAQFQNFDQNHDGQPEIGQLRPLAHAGTGDERVLMLVEQRVLKPMSGASDLLPLVQAWVNDVAADGFMADVVSVDLAKSKLHQDGRFVLALREFLRAANGEKKLAGVVLVGHFPDAMLVRTCNWSRRGDITLHRGSSQEKTYKNTSYLRRAPEVVASMADIVLADLDGHWEDVYVQPKTSIKLCNAVFPEGVPAGGGPCADAESSSKSFEDFFNISDGTLELTTNETAGAAPTYTVALGRDDANHECAAGDRSLPNVMSRPDILVSRLDARGVALRPKKSIAGISGRKFVDADGKPQAVELPKGKKVSTKSDDLWDLDPVFERQLLAEYFERNHAYRTGTAKIAWRPSSIACDLGSGFRSMWRAAGNWDTIDTKQADVRGKPTLVNFVDWMEYPAVLRTVRAHSNPIGSQFAKTDIAQLDASLGGPAWGWTKKGDRLEPSLGASCGSGMLTWSLLRSLYENGKIPPEPCFYQHGGCDAVSPFGAGTLSYEDPQYGKRPCAASLLFFGQGLALVGRAKVYYDEPAGFPQALHEGKTFGEAWARYYELESKGVSVRGAGEIGRKRAYFWSVLGDWTLRLSTGAPTKAT